MSLVVNRHELSQIRMSAAADKVMGHIQMPPECTLNNVFGNIHCLVDGVVTVIQGVMYGVDGFVLPDQDPGAIDLINDIWDFQVTKDDDFSGGMDLDAFDTDANPVFEPGEPNIANLMGLDVFNSQENRFFKRRKLITFASDPRGFEVAGPPDTYIPADVFKVRATPRIEAKVPSYAMLGFSSPAQDDVSPTSPSSLGSEAAWMQIKYLDMVLEQAFVELVGLTETGAETPWEEAADLLETLLEPTVIEETAGSFTAVAWVVFSQLTWQMSVPGHRSISQISAE